MKGSTKILTEVNRLSLSSIFETDTKRGLSSKQFKEAISKRAIELEQKFLLKKGQSVVLLEYNNINFFIDFLALWILEVTAIPLDPSFKGLGLEEFCKRIKPNVLLCHEKEEHLHQNVNQDLVGISLVLFTSGTTNSPKGVLISKSSLMKKMEIMKLYIPVIEIENALCFVPTYFGHGLICNSLYCLFNSRHFYIGPKMTLDFAADFAHLIKLYDINFFSTVPSHWEMILGFSKELEHSKLRRVHCASAPLLSEKIAPILKWLKEVPFYDVYGATEMLGWFAHRRIHDVQNSSVFNEFWCVKKTFSNERELLLESEYMFSGYWDGHIVEQVSSFNTGDLFEGDKLVGRSKNVIIKNGQKIYTDDLNSELLKSTMVQDVATFPLDDRFSGEAIGVFVVMKPGHTLEDFKNFCRKNLPSLRIPQVYRQVESIPVNNRGKGSLTLLKKAFLEVL